MKQNRCSKKKFYPPILYRASLTYPALIPLMCALAVIRTPSLNLDAFMVIFRFKARSFPKDETAILSLRYGLNIQLERNSKGYLQLTAGPAKQFKHEYRAFKVLVNNWHEIKLGIDRNKERAILSLDDQRPVIIQIPGKTPNAGALGGVGFGMKPEPTWSFADARTVHFDGSIDRFTILHGYPTKSQYRDIMKQLIVE